MLFEFLKYDKLLILICAWFPIKISQTIILIIRIIILAQSIKFHGLDKNLNIPLPVVDIHNNPLLKVNFFRHPPFALASSSNWATSKINILIIIYFTEIRRKKL